MKGVIFSETLRRTAGPMLYWSLGLGVMAFIAAWMVPLFDAVRLGEVLQNMPPVVLAAAGLDESLTALASPEGVIAVGFFGKFLLVFAAYPMVMGMRVTANEEDEGTLDVLLSLPVPRWQVMLEKTAAYALTIVFIGAVVYGSLWVGVRLSGVQVDMARMAGAVINLIPLLWLVLAFAALVGTLARRPVALGVVTGFVLGSFMINTFTSMVEGGLSAVLNAVSFFSYFDANSIAQQGANWTHVTGLLVVTALLLAASVWSFQRRDVGL